ncbi:hypothetical protein FNH13_15435 [Ornithinimicrobium ciconiae]|uniref:Uncharacterized protein n=1 Tax=Ornithinimicrobium ciconiae TaxID=2594265 RepID=A0A516GDG3_9MICO|nr:hypothetical protein [Ornithinimicrobium ciconiae]QDO89552.1 hypothetical protein FNH13_15435 [Ornithinimicrobium ciconiae]
MPNNEPEGALFPAGEGEYVDSSDPHESWLGFRELASVATFDALTVMTLLGELDAPTNADIHAFCYLGCLMSIYDGRPASDWGYAFSAVPPTLPFSPAVQGAADELLQRGLVERIHKADSLNGGDRRLFVTDEGRDEWEFFASLSAFEPRLRYLRAATATARLRSVPAVANALTNEPGLAQASKSQTVQMLLREISSKPLYEQFLLIESVLGGEHSNLVVPASVYLRVLEEQTRLEAEGDAPTGSDDAPPDPRGVNS